MPRINWMGSSIHRDIECQSDIMKTNQLLVQEGYFYSVNLVNILDTQFKVKLSEE